MLRWGYQELRRRMAGRDKPDVLVVHAPHWITMVGHPVNCVPNPRGISVEPIFPNLFRYHYDFRTDVELAEAILHEADDLGLVTSEHQPVLLLARRDPAPSWSHLAEAVRATGECFRDAGVQSVVMVSNQWFTVLGHQVVLQPLRGSRCDGNCRCRRHLGCPRAGTSGRGRRGGCTSRIVEFTSGRHT